jgi:hypothetical protein
MRRFVASVAVSLLLFGSARESSADVVATSTDATLMNQNGFFGQSFTTVTSMPETNISFNFFSDVPATTPAAFGTGFLLSQAYLGTPADLSAATPGFLAEATASGGHYSFGAAATLQPGTQYFFYENALIPAGSISGGPSAYTGGGDFFTSGGNFTGPFSGISSNFLVTGTPPSVPEPSTFALLAVAAVGLGLRTLLRSRVGRSPAPSA